MANEEGLGLAGESMTESLLHAQAAERAATSSGDAVGATPGNDICADVADGVGAPTASGVANESVCAAADEEVANPPILDGRSSEHQVDTVAADARVPAADSEHASGGQAKDSEVDHGIGDTCSKDNASKVEGQLDTGRSVVLTDVSEDARSAEVHTSPSRIPQADSPAPASKENIASSPSSASFTSSCALLQDGHKSAQRRMGQKPVPPRTHSVGMDGKKSRRGSSFDDSGAAGAGSATRDVRKVSRPSQLPHLTGVRTLVAMWIVIHHMAPREPSSGVSVFTMRVDIAVELFMILSGFVWHYNYGCEDYITASGGSLLKFYVCRLSRIVLTTQASVAMCLFWEWFGGSTIFTYNTTSCLLFLRPWWDANPSCPNPPTWFLAATLPSWLLYPIVTRRLLHAVNTRNGLFTFCCVLWLFAIGPQLVLIGAQGDWLTWEQVKNTWFWPGAQLADFALGCCVAGLVRNVPPEVAFGSTSRQSAANAVEPSNDGETGRCSSSSEWLVPLVADCALLTVILACIFCPVAEEPDDWTGPVDRPGHFMAWDGISGRLSAPLLAVWIYCSSCKDGAQSLGTRFLSHPILVSLGAYTLEVYLLQTPLHDMFTWTKDTLYLAPDSTEVFMLYVFVVWLASVSLVDVVTAPADKWLRAKTEDWANRRVQDVIYDLFAELINAAQRWKAKYSAVAHEDVDVGHSFSRVERGGI